MMKNNTSYCDSFNPAVDIGRRLRDLFGEVHGGLDDRMLELLHELDFVPSLVAEVREDELPFYRGIAKPAS